MPVLYLAILAVLAIFWGVGEAEDKPLLRRICGPLFALLLAAVVGMSAVVHTSFNDAARYSAATKRFVAALVASIDRGAVERAHDELRHFDDISMETYEGGTFLRWLTEPVERLDADRDDAKSDQSASDEGRDGNREQSGLE